MSLKPSIEREIDEFIAYLDEEAGGDWRQFSWIVDCVRERLARAVIAHPDNVEVL